jgi:chemotaxis protein methyltransferase CheR
VLSQADFDYLRTPVQQRSAIVLDSDKAYLAETRLLRLARREGLPSVSALVSRLLAGPGHGLDDEVVEALTTNESSFFRDLHPFEALAQTLLPELVRRRAAERRLNLWSAGCASGQEPYSLALLLLEKACLPPGWSVRLIASDLSSRVLAQARKGRYSQMEVNRGLPAAMLVKYFQREGLDWQLKDEVRRTVEFVRINLIEPWPVLPRMDIVFLRNVLIYFGVQTRKTILAQMRQVLRPDGYLFLGGAETTFNLDDGYERVALDRVNCYRLR